MAKFKEENKLIKTKDELWGQRTKKLINKKNTIKIDLKYHK